MSILTEASKDKWQFADEFVLKSRKINAQLLSRIRQHELKLENVEKVKPVSFFSNRKSFRNDMECVGSDNIARIVEALSPSLSYRPTPLAGNLDFIKYVFYSNCSYTLYSFKGDLIYKSDVKTTSSFLSYLKKQTNRSDIHGIGGDYFFPLITTTMLQLKYEQMSKVLSFTTLGCFLQNFVLVLNSLGISSCIHFGAIDYTEWIFQDDIYSIPCFIRFGYEKRN